MRTASAPAPTTTTGYGKVDGAPPRRGPEPTLNVRDARGAQRTIDETLRRLADDPGAAAGAAGLVAELGGALADTGPLEVGVPASRFVSAVEGAEKMRAKLEGVDAVTRRRQVARALRGFRGLFREAAATARVRDRVPAKRRIRSIAMVAGWGVVAAVLAGAFVSALRGSSGEPAVVFAVWSAAVAMIIALSAMSPRTEMIARDAMYAASPGERLLLAAVLIWPMSLLGYRVWIATDRRLFIVERTRRRGPARLVRSVEYARITALSHEASAEERMRVKLGLDSEHLELSVDAASGKASLIILCRRTGLPALSPPARHAEWFDRVRQLVRRRPRP